MRASRAYLAGFGTSGSLLAGAAVLFLLGSAIVAFRGWPQIGAGPATSNVTAAPLPAASRIARRLTVALAATRPRAVARSGPGATARPATKPARGGTFVNGGVPGGGSPASTANPATPAGRPTTSAGSTGGLGECGACSQPSSGNAVTALSDTVTRTVSNVGSSVGNQVKSLSGSVGGQVGGLSSQAGSTVTSAGSGVGNSVTDATNTVASVVSTATGGGH